MRQACLPGQEVVLGRRLGWPSLQLLPDDDDDDDDGDDDDGDDGDDDDPIWKRL